MLAAVRAPPIVERFSGSTMPFSLPDLTTRDTRHRKTQPLCELLIYQIAVLTVNVCICYLLIPMGQQLKPRIKRRRRQLRVKRLKERAREAAASK